MKPILRIGCSSLFRPSDSFQAYEVVLDGQVVARLRGGERASFPITSEKHELSVRMNRRESQMEPFEASEGEEVEFEFGNEVSGGRILILLSYYLPFLRNDYLWLKKLEKPRVAGLDGGEKPEASVKPCSS